MFSRCIGVCKLFRNRQLLKPIFTVARILLVQWESAPRWTPLATILMLLEIGFGLAVLFLIKRMMEEWSHLVVPHSGADDTQAAILYTVLSGVMSVAYLSARALAGLARQAQGIILADHIDGLFHERAIQAVSLSS